MSDVLRVAVVDDELVARRRLTRIARELPDVEVVGSYASASELLTELERAAPHVVLLDIQMPELNGLQTSALLAAQQGPCVIFVTAHSEHALEAFDLGVLDYLLKPVDGTRLARALDRARRSLATHQADSAPSATSDVALRSQRLPLHTRKGVVLVEPASIDHAAYDGQLVTLRVGSEELICALSLSELEARLPEATLMRVHRRYLLNLSAVQRLEAEPDGGYLAHTRQGAQVPIARQAARALRKRLGW